MFFNKEHIYRPIAIWCILISFGLLLYQNKGEMEFMGIAQWVAISIALLGIAGGIWGQIIQFKKDAQRIDVVNNKTACIEKDTSIMKPIVERTDNNVQEIRDKMLSKEETFGNALAGISELLEAKRVSDATRQSVSSSVGNPIYIQSAIELIYERNAALEMENARLQNEILQLKSQNRILQDKNKKLEGELTILHSIDEPER